jgi:hypothetical protein
MAEALKLFPYVVAQNRECQAAAHGLGCLRGSKHASNDTFTVF